jgi:hypothetical protein
LMFFLSFGVLHNINLRWFSFGSGPTVHVPFPSCVVGVWFLVSFLPHHTQ